MPKPPYKMVVGRLGYEKPKDEMDVQDFYFSGYECGYTWLIQGEKYINGFKHPSERGGYIPGGPLIFSKFRDYNSRNSDPFPGQARDAWRKGFIEGINDYVSERGLHFPQVDLFA